MSQGHVQLLSGLLRVYPKAKSFENKDAYEWCCTIVHVDEDTVELCGVTKTPSKEIWRAVAKTLKDAGYKEARFIRYRRGSREVHTFTR